MPHIVVENGEQRGKKAEIPVGGTVAAGRDSKAEIPITDHLCSRRHFEVTESGGKYILRDLGSSNGTYVNDQRVSDAELAHGDCIQIGETQFTFLDESGTGSRGLTGKMVGGYRILERIGRGGMGTVFKANQVSLNRIVALKILSHKVAQDPAFVKRFLKEAQAAGRLNHPNIVQVYDVASEGGLHYYSMELIENGSVQDLATRTGKLSVDLAVATILDAGKGLEYAEKRGLVHRDIKPDNLMINSEGVVKIADLGLARDAGEAARESDAHAGEHPRDDEGIFGTPHFISPEQAQGKACDTRSDIYSLGATFYRLLAGQTPFSGESVREIIFKQINESPAPIRELNREIPASIAQIIEKMMRKDPGERFQSAATLVEELERANRDLEQGANKGRKILAAAAVLAVLGATGYFIFTKSDEKPAIPTPVVQNPADNEQAAKLRIELEKKDREARAKDAYTQAKVFDVAAVGAQRDLAHLEAARKRFQEIVSNADFADTETAGSVCKGDLIRIENELAALRDKTANDAARRQAAEDAAKARAAAAIASADAAEKEGRFGAAVSALTVALDASELKLPSREIHIKPIQDRLSQIGKLATQKAGEIRDLAKSDAVEMRYDDAIARIERAIPSFTELCPEGEGGKRLRDLVQEMNEESKRYAQQRDQKKSADRASDLATLHAVRREVAELFQRSFNPEKARLVVEAGVEKARTDSARAEFEPLRTDITAAHRIRTALQTHFRGEAQRGAQIKLPSQADASRLLSYTLVEVKDAGFVARLGQAEPKSFAFVDFKPSAVYELMLKGRVDDSSANAKDIARLLLIGGTPDLVLQVLADLKADDPEAAELLQRAERELKAKEALVEIRTLERDAAKEPRRWLELLPKVDAFLSNFAGTLVHLLNTAAPMVTDSNVAPR